MYAKTVGCQLISNFVPYHCEVNPLLHSVIERSANEMRKVTPSKLF